MNKTAVAHLSPGRVILLSFFLVILIGTALLALPCSRTGPIPLIDLFFTAASTTCVTGLFTVSLDQFTFIGHLILLALIQIGALGLITMSLFVVSLFADLGLSTQVLAGQLLEFESWKHVRKTLFFIVVTTFTVELIGGIVTYFLIPTMGTKLYTAFVALFHAVSAFSNAGVSLFTYSDNGGGGSDFPFSHSPLMLITTIIMMLLGGLGFITWKELYTYLKSFRAKKRYHFSLHSYIVLIGSATVIILGTIFVFLLEYDGVFREMNLPLALLNSFFHAISFRSTGFLAVNLHDMQLATYIIIMILGFIGTSPGSMGSGGIKITALWIYLSSIKTTLLGKTTVEIHSRQIANDQLYKTFTIVTLSIIWTIIVTFLLTLTEQQWNLLDYLFEVISAFATSGLSTGITSHLSPTGKFLIIATMIMGRVGSLTLILALRKTKKDHIEFSYPTERVMLG